MGMLAIVWLLANTGIIVRLSFVEGFPQQLGHIMFLVMGWLGVLSAYWIRQDYGWAHVIPLAMGGRALHGWRGQQFTWLAYCHPRGLGATRDAPFDRACRTCISLARVAGFSKIRRPTSDAGPNRATG